MLQWKCLMAEPVPSLSVAAYIFDSVVLLQAGIELSGFYAWRNLWIIMILLQLARILLRAVPSPFQKANTAVTQPDVHWNGLILCSSVCGAFATRALVIGTAYIGEAINWFDVAAALVAAGTLIQLVCLVAVPACSEHDSLLWARRAGLLLGPVGILVTCLDITWTIILVILFSLLYLDPRYCPYQRTSQPAPEAEQPYCTKRFALTALFLGATASQAMPGYYWNGRIPVALTAAFLAFSLSYPKVTQTKWGRGIPMLLLIAQLLCLAGEYLATWHFSCNFSSLGIMVAVAITSLLGELEPFSATKETTSYMWNYPGLKFTCINIGAHVLMIINLAIVLAYSTYLTGTVYLLQIGLIASLAAATLQLWAICKWQWVTARDAYLWIRLSGFIVAVIGLLAFVYPTLWSNLIVYEVGLLLCYGVLTDPSVSPYTHCAQVDLAMV